MEPNGDQSPVTWPQFQSMGYRRQPSPIIVVLTVAFLLLLLVVVPSFLSITSQIVRSTSVNKGWDSINVFLVIFAILCGVLARWNDDGSPLPPPPYGEDDRALTDGAVNSYESITNTSPVSQRWFSDVYAAERLMIYENACSSSSPAGLPAGGAVRLRRSSSSYPNLRQGDWETADYRFRFYDDSEIGKYGSPAINASDDYEQIRRHRRQIRTEESEAKEIPVDKYEVRPALQGQLPPTIPPPPPPKPPHPEILRKPRLVNHSVRSEEMREKTRNRDTDSNVSKRRRAHPSVAERSPPPPPPPTPMPPRTGTMYETERKQGKIERNKSNATKEIRTVLASLYNQRKRKGMLQKAKSNQSNEYLATEPPHHHSTLPPPPPPPLPSPPPPRPSQSVFNGLFKKGGKNRKVHSIPTPPPTPPPPPPSHTSSRNKREVQLDQHSPPPEALPQRRSSRLPCPTKPTNLDGENYAKISKESPLIPLPPPPPPPFKMPSLKFVVSGDFAKIRRNQSSKCGSPERELIDLSWGLEEEEVDLTKSGDGSSAFCRSPDVNIKADSFIAKLRDEWRLEKINSEE